MTCIVTERVRMLFRDARAQRRRAQSFQQYSVSIRQFSLQQTVHS